MNAITQLSPDQLRKAADLQERIVELQSELNAVLGGEISLPGKTGSRNMSAAGRAAISAAAKARWAKYRGAGPKAPKRKMSAEGRARLAAAVKARWAKAKKAGKTTL